MPRTFFFSSCFLLFLSSFGIAPLLSTISTDSETLILFRQADDPMDDQSAQALAELAQKMGISFQEKWITSEVPEQVLFTPSIYYQNSMGRSLYKGRYANLSRIKNFVRTSRRNYQAPTALSKEKLLIHQDGRMFIGAPLKITPLSGKSPKGYQETIFLADAERAIEDGMTKYSLQSNVLFSPSGRLFYMACYPYFSKGKLFLSLELYSQFNCIEPIFKQFDLPISGTYSDRQELFMEAGQVFAKMIDKNITESKIGDAFMPIETAVQEISWEEMGFRLPMASQEEKAAFSGPLPSLPATWEMDGFTESGDPIIQFSFPPPVNQYAGEMTQMNGSMKFDTLKGLASLAGQFTVPMKSLTMGDDGLTQAVQHAMLFVDQFPESSFEFKSAQVNEPNLAFGTVNPIQLNGTFTMQKVSVPIQVIGQIEPVLNDNNEARLLIDANFEITDLTPTFKVKGPDGPSPANNTVQFVLHFLMKPSE